MYTKILLISEVLYYHDISCAPLRLWVNTSYFSYFNTIVCNIQRN